MVPPGQNDILSNTLVYDQYLQNWWHWHVIYIRPLTAFITDMHKQDTDTDTDADGFTN